MLWDSFRILPLGTLTTRRRSRIPWRTLLFVCFLFFNACLFSISIVQIIYKLKIRETIYDIPPADVTIVLGAAVKKDGTPSDALQDRIETAVRLYNAGATKVLLMTGDGGGRRQDEVSAMKQEAMRLGVPEQFIVTDPEGYRTFESCRRTIEQFHVTKAIVVTQKFHLPRALFLCNELGVESYGLVADQQKYEKATFFKWREYFASAKAFWDIYIRRPKSPV